MQQWLQLAVLVSLDGGGETETGTLVSYDDATFTLQLTSGLMTIPQGRLHSIVAAPAA